MAVEGAPARRRLRSGAAHPVQVHPLPAWRRTGLGPAGGAADAAHRLSGHLGSDITSEAGVSGAGGLPARAARHAARTRAGRHTELHRVRRRCARLDDHGMEVRHTRDGRHRCALGRDEQLHAQRHHQSRFQPGRDGRGADSRRRALRVVLSRVAPVLRGRQRTVRRAESPREHAPDRRAAGRDQAHGQDPEDRCGSAHRDRRCSRQRRWVDQSDLHDPAPASRPRRPEQRRHGVHRSHGRRVVQPRGGARFAAAVSRCVQQRGAARGQHDA